MATSVSSEQVQKHLVDTANATISVAIASSFEGLMLHRICIRIRLWPAPIVLQGPVSYCCSNFVPLMVSNRHLSLWVNALLLVNLGDPFVLHIILHLKSLNLTPGDRSASQIDRIKTP